MLDFQVSFFVFYGGIQIIKDVLAVIGLMTIISIIAFCIILAKSHYDDYGGGKMKFSNKTYDVLKWIAQVVLPALATLYGIIGKTFDIPLTQEIITLIIAVDAFMGSVLGLSSINYNKEDGQDG